MELDKSLIGCHLAKSWWSSQKEGDGEILAQMMGRIGVGQIFTAPPMRVGMMSPQARDFGKWLIERGKDVVYHGPYLVTTHNLNSPMGPLTVELVRSVAAWAKVSTKKVTFVLHTGKPGKSQDIEGGMSRFLDEVAPLIQETGRNMQLLLETDSSQHPSLSLTSLLYITSKKNEKYGSRLFGVCLDTEHVYASGNYPILDGDLQFLGSQAEN